MTPKVNTSASPLRAMSSPAPSYKGFGWPHLATHTGPTRRNGETWRCGYHAVVLASVRPPHGPPTIPRSPACRYIDTLVRSKHSVHTTQYSNLGCASGRPPPSPRLSPSHPRRQSAPPPRHILSKSAPSLYTTLSPNLAHMADPAQPPAAAGSGSRQQQQQPPSSAGPRRISGLHPGSGRCWSIGHPHILFRLGVSQPVAVHPHSNRSATVR